MTCVRVPPDRGSVEVRSCDRSWVVRVVGPVAVKTTGPCVRRELLWERAEPLLQLFFVVLKKAEKKQLWLLKIQANCRIGMCTGIYIDMCIYLHFTLVPLLNANSGCMRRSST